MEQRIRNAFRAAGALALAGMLWGGSAAAQSSSATQVSGTSSGSGKITRTIIDVVPYEAPRLGVESIRIVTCTINSAGVTSNQVGRMFRDSCNVQVGPFGYTASFCPATDSSRVLLQKSTGSFDYSDVNTIAGITLTPIINCPGISVMGLWLLLAGLPGLALWWLRRARTA